MAVAPSCFFGAQPADFGGIDRGLAPLIDAAPLGRGDPFELALATQSGLELGEHPEHIQERLAGGVGGIDRLLGRHQGRAPLLERLHDVLQILDAACQAVDTRDHEGVSGPQERQQQGEFGAAVARGPADLLRAHDVAGGRPQGGLLRPEVLVDRGHAGVTVAGHRESNRLVRV